MLARCPGAFFLLFLPVILISTGCRNKTDLVEMELRNRETLYRDLLESSAVPKAHSSAATRT